MRHPDRAEFERHARRLQAEEVARILGLLRRGIVRAVRWTFALVMRSGLRRWAEALRAHRERAQAIAELRAMDQRGLRDLGLNRAGIAYAVDHGREDPPTPANTDESGPRRAAG